ncbi:MAG: ABC transporter permease [Thiotrichales bacterium]|nr:ABC transporter permease [Thiotrichales bacterium]
MTTAGREFDGAEAPRTDDWTPLRNFVSDFCESRLAVVSLFVFVGVVLAALFAPFISIQNPYDLAQIDILDGTMPPGSRSASGSTYLLGTDDQGRDMVSAILYGLRISLGVGAISGLVAMLLGVFAGIVAAQMGGRVDTLIMRIVDVQLGFPAILIALILLAVLGRGADKVIIALIASQWVYYARVARGAALVELRKDYMESARCLSLSTTRIVLRHLLPNCLPPLIVIGTVEIAHAIALEATLSFLGVGMPITEPSLGLLISNGYGYLLSGRYWISFYPGIALLITIASINFVGDQLRDVLNPRLQR